MILGTALATAVMGGRHDTARPVPSGFTSAVPFGFKVYRTRGTRNFTTTHDNISSPITTGTAGVVVKYVDKATGNDGNPGTSGSPYQTLKFALNALVGETHPVLIYVKGGSYNYGEGWDAVAVANPSIAVISWDGQPVISTTERTLSWSSAGSGAYSASMATSFGTSVTAWDGKFPVTDGAVTAYGHLALATSSANCIATAGTYFANNTTVWVHTTDGRAPDSDVHVFDGTSNGFYNKAGGTCYLENLRFFGGQQDFVLRNPATGVDPDVSNKGTFWTKDCHFAYCIEDGCDQQGAWNILHLRPVSHDNGADGIAYAKYDAASPCGTFIEIGAISYRNGYTATAANNASTHHDSWGGIRVNGYYHHCQDRNIHDIGTGGTWMLGCRSEYSLNTGGAQSNFRMAGSSMYLDCCNSVGSVYDLQCDSGASIFCNEFVGDATATGTGTIGLYDPDNDAGPTTASILTSFGVSDTGLLIDITDGFNTYTANGVSTAAIAGTVGMLQDRSGKSNHIFNRTVAENPLLRNDSGAHYIEFDGTDDRLLSAFTFAGPFTRVSLIRVRTAAAGRYLFGGTTGANALLWMPGGALAIYSGTSISLTLPLNVWLVVTEININGSSSSINVKNLSNSAVTSNSGNAGSNSFTGMGVGGDASTTGHASPLDFKRAALINRVLSGSELTNWQSWAETGV